MHEQAIIALSMIGFVAILCQWFAWWAKLPAIVFLLISGIILGPATNILNPEALFGDLLFPVISLSVAIILFEGSLTLNFHEIKGLQYVVRNMLTIGVLTSWAAITIGTHFIIGFSWDLSLLFGALMVVTGPTVIVPILRTVRPNATVSNILRWEGIIIDPLGAILAVLVFEMIITVQLQGDISVLHTIFIFIRTLVIGSTIGAVAAYLFGLLLRHHWVPEYLHNVMALTLVFVVFSLANHYSEESGLLAVTVMGMWLANMKNVHIEDILDFKESLSLLLISGLFILLAARLDFSQVQMLGWSSGLLFLFIQLFARPLKVILSTINSDLTWQEKFMVSWIGPRGIVAAAFTALFALRLEELGFEQAPLLVPLAFTIIIGTVILQGATSRYIANYLGVAEPESNGFLIVGANSVARFIATALQNNGFNPLLTDDNWSNIKQARMEGLKTYYGNAVSVHADRHLDLVGLGNLLALTPQQDRNALAAQRYKTEFGHQHIYDLATEPEKDKQNNEEASRKTISHNYPMLFSKDISYSKLASLISQDAKIKQTQLSENFTFENYRETHGKRVITLFAFNEKNQIRFFTTEQEFQPELGWTVVALVTKEDN